MPRRDYRLATKVHPRSADGALLTPTEVEAAIERSLARLETDVIDVFQVHALRLADYDAVVATQPARARPRARGGPDPGHRRDRVVRR